MACRLASCLLLVGHASGLLMHEQKVLETTNETNSWTTVVESASNMWGHNTAWVTVWSDRPGRANTNVGMCWHPNGDMYMAKFSGKCTHQSFVLNVRTPTGVTLPGAGEKAKMVATFYTNRTAKMSLLWVNPDDGTSHIHHAWTQLSFDFFMGDAQDMHVSSRSGNEGNGDCCGCPELVVGEDVTTYYSQNRARFDFTRHQGFLGAHDGEDPAAVGDPHCQNVKNEQFEIRQRGLLDFIRVPRAAKAKLLVQAEIDGLREDICSKTFIKSFSVSGTGVETIQVMATENGPVLVRGEASKALSHSDGKVDERGLMKTQLGNMVFAHKQVDQRWSELSVPRWNLTFTMETRMHRSLPYLNLHTHGLKELGDDVGGILGWDSHWHAEHDAPEDCNQRAKVGRADNMEASTVKVD